MNFPNQDPDKLVAVFENIDASLVWIARDTLESVGIESFIFDEDTSRIFGVRGRLLVPSRLMVYADKADEARVCLRDVGFEK